MEHFPKFKWKKCSFFIKQTIYSQYLISMTAMVLFASFESDALIDNQSPPNIEIGFHFETFTLGHVGTQKHPQNPNASAFQSECPVVLYKTPKHFVYGLYLALRNSRQIHGHPLSFPSTVK